jgi:hypothetical protein
MKAAGFDYDYDRHRDERAGTLKSDESYWRRAWFRW